MIVTPERSFLHSDTELTALDRARYLALARERKQLGTEQAALNKKLKALGNKAATESERDSLKSQLADLGKRLDAATQGMDQCQLWRSPSSWQHCLVLAGTTLVAGGTDEVAALNATDGSLAWRHPVRGRAYGIAASDGALFISTDQGTIHCLRTGTTQASLSTPTTASTEISR